MTDRPIHSEAEQVQRRVKQLLSSGAYATELEPHAGRVLAAVPIRSPRGATEAWFVGIAVDAALVGFFVIDRTLQVQRYSSFVQRPGELTGCPAVADWLDPHQIVALASREVRQGEKLSTPILSYDRMPDRIAWRLQAVDETGRERTIFVAGTFVYEATVSDDEPSTG